MATDRPKNSDSMRPVDDTDDSLVTYEPQEPSVKSTSPAGGTLRRIWPLLLLVVGGVFTAAALWSWSSNVSAIGPAEYLERADAAMRRGDLHIMRNNLESFAGQWLHDSSPLEQSSYYRLSGDWVSMWQQVNGIDEQENHQRIVRNYEQAEALGGLIDDASLERWAMATIGAGTPMSTRGFLDRLRTFDPEQFPLAPQRVHRVHRAWIHAVLMDSESQNIDVLKELADFREAAGATGDDRQWATLRMAEHRLAAGRVDDAVRMLHVDLRRFEADEAPPAARAELLVLLGRGYRALSQWKQAAGAVQLAIELCEPTNPVRGEAWVLLGQMHSAQGELEEAFDCYDRALAELPATASNLPAYVGRGETSSLLGNHRAARADLAEAGRLLQIGRTHPDVDVTGLTAVYMDRYEAVLLQGLLDHALAYASAAERLHGDGECPGSVAHAVAMAAGQLARDLESKLPADFAGPLGPMDPHVRSLHGRITDLHVQAADAHRHAARWWHDQPNEHERWRTSLVEAARHDDSAGRTTEAIEAFTEALAATEQDDPRRGALMERLGRCLQAEARFDEAAGWYRAVIETWPSSPDATRCHVPLARCLEAMGDVDSAWQSLERVVHGRTVLTPDALDWMDALQELGALGFRTGRYSDAIPHLDAYLARVQETRKRTDGRLLLAACTRGAARQLQQRLADDPTLAPSMREVIEARRRALLDRSCTSYEQVVLDCEQSPVRTAGVHELLRAAMIGHGDALYDLDRFEEAIVVYERTARDFADDAASMHALVQIAGAWVELGDRARAAAAHARALHRLESMPDDELTSIDSLMDREIWERWMRIMPVGAQVATAEDG